MGSIALGMMVAVMVSGPVAVQDATETATRLLEDGSAKFNAKDAAGLADQYVSDAEITLVGFEDGRLQSQDYRGKEQIHKLYVDMFRNSSTVRAKNVVEYARFVGPDLLLIAGTFELSLSKSNVQFVQVRVKEDDGIWRIRDLQLFPIPNP